MSEYESWVAGQRSMSARAVARGKGPVRRRTSPVRTIKQSGYGIRLIGSSPDKGLYMLRGLNLAGFLLGSAEESDPSFRKLLNNPITPSSICVFDTMETYRKTRKYADKSLRMQWDLELENNIHNHLLIATRALSEMFWAPTDEEYPLEQWMIWLGLSDYMELVTEFLSFPFSSKWSEKLSP